MACSAGVVALATVFVAHLQVDALIVAKCLFFKAVGVALSVFAYPVFVACVSAASAMIGVDLQVGTLIGAQGLCIGAVTFPFQAQHVVRARFFASAAMLGVRLNIAALSFTKLARGLAGSHTFAFVAAL